MGPRKKVAPSFFSCTLLETDYIHSCGQRSPPEKEPIMLYAPTIIIIARTLYAHGYLVEGELLPLADLCSTLCDLLVSARRHGAHPFAYETAVRNDVQEGVKAFCDGLDALDYSAIRDDYAADDVSTASAWLDFVNLCEPLADDGTPCEQAVLWILRRGAVNTARRGLRAARQEISRLQQHE